MVVYKLVKVDGQWKPDEIEFNMGGYEETIWGWQAMQYLARMKRQGYYIHNETQFRKTW